MTFPEGAIGAILAALIAAVASLLGLIVSKEQKVSDLRQAWIDALREDLSSLLASASEIAFSPHKLRDDADSRERILSIVSDANSRMYRVKLRLNLKNDEALELNSSIDNLKRLGEIAPHPEESEMEAAEDLVVAKAQTVLKAEWERVKRGEPAYRWLRNGLLALLSVLLIVFGVSIFGSKSLPKQERPGPTVSVTVSHAGIAPSETNPREAASTSPPEGRASPSK